MASPAQTLPAEPGPGEDVDLGTSSSLTTYAYWAMHASCLFAFATGVSAQDLVLCASLVVVRMFGITGGYHRYFSHRTYRTGRVMQFLLALLGCTAVQKGPLWWAAIHRRHHKHSDTPEDPHSSMRGFAWSHYQWIFSRRWQVTELDRVRDLAKFPELVWLNRWHLVPVVALGVGCFLFGGWSGLVWGFVISTVILWHFTYSINSLAHIWGSRPYKTDDDSRNNLFLALITLGEGWHNNHHHYQASTRNGFKWWEIDVTYYVLRVFAALGLVYDLREPPAETA